MVGERRLLDGLDPEQRAAVLAPRGPVCVLAGAGTGKTRTITRRIAALVHQGHVAPGQVLAVTFTARAAAELRTRLRDLGVGGVQARTFHAAALRQLRYFWPRVVGEAPWHLLERKPSLVAQAAHRLGVDTERETLRDLIAEIEWAKGTLVTPGDYPRAAARRTPPVAAELTARVYDGYERLKNEARLLDFDDLLLHTAAALEEHQEVAGEFRDRYRCFVVDEYQDVTPLQQRVLDAWLGDRDDLTVVGDANQTIYSFAGASPRWLLGFSRRYQGATVVRLERDYRSTPQVVALANGLIDRAKERPAGSRLRLVGQRQDGPEPAFGEYDDEPAEARAVARRIRELVEAGTEPSEIAVLYRINAQSEVYEQALSEAGIAYQVRGGERFFARQEVRQAMVALRTAAGEEGPERGQGEADLPARVRAVLAPLGLTAEAPPGQAARERWESLRALADLAVDLARAVPEAGLRRFHADLDMRAEAQFPPTVQGVTLASLHAAKGLEWDAVFLVGLVDGTLPIQHAEGDDAAIEEERRLLYVGVTRAREQLWLSWSLAKAEGGRRYRRRSRFLHGVIPDGHPVSLASRTRRREEENAGRAPARPTCRVCGRVLVGASAVTLARCADCPSDVDQDLLERLRRWRAERATTLRVPAFVILSDATLLAVAEQRPVDRAGLVAIPGIGATKLDRYGAGLLAVLREKTQLNG
ncbi:ATP-dependent DNA helicase UvrD2 [Actinoalloteichus spitiensis]|uniref:ATP-dependent DNA helicase UvrD2 n=1 Tax=Actinoalloteichus spitiensis TaxID=252394 RepID=UPI00037299C0|nr:ATP-dependent DNA helicase UvrD2 [Actinoalloteichus spitiensis]